MAITHFGNKMLRGTKLDRVSDSLGSSADGTNTGITLVESPFLGSGLQFTGTGDYNRVYWSTANNWKYLHDDTTDWSINFWVSFTDQSDVQNIFTNMHSALANIGFQLLFDPAGNGNNAIRVRLGNGTSSARANWTTSNDFIPAFDTRYMITITYDATSNVITIYRDGSNSENSGALTNSVSTSNPTTALRLGADTQDSTTWRMKGKFNQLLFYKKKLSTSEISALYNSGNGDTTPDTSDLYGWFKWDSNGTDTQGNNNATVDSGVSYQGSPKLGTGCYSFDGSSSRVDLPSDMATIGGTVGSIVGWINLDTIQDGEKIITWGDTNGNEFLILEMEATGIIIAQFRISGSNQWKCKSSNGSISTGNWIHFAVVQDGTEPKIYINGTEDTSFDITSDKTKWLGAGTALDNCTIGCSNFNSGGNANFLDGRIDDFAYFNRALSSTEIGKLANNNTPASQGWTESLGNVTIDGANTEMDFSIESGGNTAKAYYDLTSTSDTSWVLRIEDWNLSTLNTYGGMWIGLSSITSMDWANTGSSILMRLADFGDGDDYIITDSFNNSTSRVEGSAGRPALSTGTNYNLELIRDGTTITAKIFTTDFTGTPLATSTDTISGTTGLRYLVVENYYNTGSGNTNTNMVGTIQAIKFWNSTTTASGDPTYSTTFTAGDAQLVSSLSDKSNLKAYYSMDSDTATQLFEVTGSNGTGWTSSGTSINFNSAHSNAIGSTSTSGGDYVVRSVSDLTGGSTTYFDNDKWLIDFEFYHTGTSNNLFIEASSDNPSYSGSYYAIAFNMQDNGVDWYGILSNNNNGTRTEAFNMNFAEDKKGDNMYGRLIRDGNTVTCRIWNTDSTRSGNGDFSSTQTINSAITNLDRLSIWANGSGGNYYFKNIKVYNGVTNTSVCKNDFSSTSDLEALTGVRTNSIFQQTDDTPSYWWYNGTSWVLDGTSTWDSNFAQFSTQAEGEAKWITSDSSRLNYGGVGSGSDSNKYIDWDLRNDDSNDTIYYNLGKTVNSSKWVLRFKINFSDLASNTSTQGLLGLSSITGSADSTQDFLGIAFLTGDDQIRGISTDSNPNGIPSTYNASIDWQEDTDYYIQIERTSATAFKAYVRTGSYSGTTLASITNGVTTSTIGGLQYIKIQNRITNNSPSPRLTIQEVGLLDGFSEWE